MDYWNAVALVVADDDDVARTVLDYFELIDGSDAVVDSDDCDALTVEMMKPKG